MQNYCTSTIYIFVLTQHLLGSLTQVGNINQKPKHFRSSKFLNGQPFKRIRLYSY